MFDKEAVKEIARSESISAATKAIRTEVDGVLALPEDFKLHNVEQYFNYRRRARGTMATTSIEDFAVYTKQHIDEAPGHIFVDPSEMAATAILNMGSTSQPGHTDNRAKLTLKRTAAYQALMAVSGSQLPQDRAAEFLEDWTANISCVNENGAIATKHAVAAIRKITIESSAKVESAVNQLSASKSAFEAIAASSKDPIPQEIDFVCQPYHGLPDRTFSLRLSVVTGAKPLIVLRLIKQEQHEEEMANEFAELVRNSFADDQSKALVMIGTYKPNP